MARRVLVALIVAIALEVWLLVEVGDRIGALSTLLLLVGTGLAGVWLAQREGRRAWTEVQRQLQSGQPPGHALLNGLCVLAGGILLMLPGFLSDLAGLTLLLPATRPIYRRLLYRWLEKRMRGGGRFTIIRK